MQLLVLALALAALASPAGEGAAPLDELVLRSGEALRGRVLWQDERVVLLEQEGAQRELPRAQVQSVLTLEDRVGEVLDRLESLEPSELEQEVELAERARELGLVGEADVLLLRVVLRDATHERARELLGHKRVGSAWRARFESEWLPLTLVARKRMTWSDAWQFDTAHYSLRTNLDLPQALEVALDLEIAYRAFHEVLGRPLGLHHVGARLQAEVHSDRASLPAFDDDLQGWFDWDANRLVVDASARLDRSLLFHEATHQLLFNTHPGMRAGTLRLPAWLDEGLAEFLQAGLSQRTVGFRQVPGRTFDFDWRSWWQPHVDLVLRAPQPPALAEVLALRPPDFAGNRGYLLAYAQAYTLVDYLMNADSGRLQGELFAWLRDARRRTLTGEEFLLRFTAGDAQRFEREWLAYVQEFAREPERAARRRQHVLHEQLGP